ncbi:nucleolar complex protein 14 [Cichlidogyrus casuarinus]|uniref:Nucleolar complex protein 14 n=1 Tax=Cichlidogyrus casuarinus TaxID=1844966 RepID=A0ABD2QK43_9PLAT
MSKNLRKKQQLKGRLKAIKRREKTFEKQIKQSGKIGGIVDKRINSANKNDCEASNALKRHIIEKLRQMDQMADDFTKIDQSNNISDEFIVKAAERASKYDAVDFDDDENLDASFVEDTFFSNERKESYKDILSRKIAETKLQRSKKVEANEQQRERTRNADEEWSDKMRYMLEKFASLKPKNVADAETLEKKAQEVRDMLDALKCKRAVVPIGSSTLSNLDKSIQQLQKLENVIEQSEAPSSIETKDRSLADCLRVLFEIDGQCDSAALFLCHQLRSFPSIPLLHQFVGLSQTVKNKTPKVTILGLFYAELLLYHFIKRKQFSYELPLFLANVLPSLVTNLSDVQPRDFSLKELHLDVEWINNDFKLKTLNKDRLMWSLFWRALNLAQASVDYCSSINIALVTRQLHHYFYGIFEDLSSKCEIFPAMFKKKVVDIDLQLKELQKEPLPRRLKGTDKLGLLLSNKAEIKSKELIKFGLVPQLEPRFDDELVFLFILHLILSFSKSKSKKQGVSNLKILKNKFKKEKRGAMKELRKDSMHLSAINLKKTKSELVYTRIIITCRGICFRLVIFIVLVRG